MNTFSLTGRQGVSAVLAAALFASGMLYSMPRAAAASCSIIAEQLWHQNDPLQDAKTRLTTCAEKHAKYPETLDSKSESAWEQLCDGDKAYYTTLLANRQQILVQCRPRGSDG
jgi:hypothetical protein